MPVVHVAPVALVAPVCTNKTVLEAWFAIFHKNNPPAVLMVCTAGTIIVRVSNSARKPYKLKTGGGSEAIEIFQPYRSNKFIRRVRGGMVYGSP